MAVITVLHAYSARNRGDGWLVQLTHQLLADAGIAESEVTTVALEPTTFVAPRYGEFIGSSAHAPELLSRFDLPVRAVASVVKGLGPVKRQVLRSDMVVAVGGGYLRSGHATEAAKTLLAHGPQLALAARAPCPTIYLPQSIGPLDGAVGKWVRNQLASIDRVYVRDNTSLQEVPFAVRAPDLAALEVGNAQPCLRHGRDTVFSVRSVRNETTHKNLAALNLRLQPDVLGIQSLGGGNEDGPITNRIANANQRVEPMAKAVANAGAVVAVRLHAAVASIAAGVPTIHLSYERKGWGVYQDLGISEWVHDVHNFDCELVAKQTEQLKSDPTAYWSAISAGYQNLVAQRRQIVAYLSSSAAVAGAR